jgi:hypothetical protein
MSEDASRLMFRHKIEVKRSNMCNEYCIINAN